jgi:antitoxin CptB
MADLNDPNVKMLLYRCKYTGTKETDELLYRFALRHLPTMTAEQTERFAALVDDADPDLYMWISRRRPVPEKWDDDVMALLQDFTL